MCSGRAAQSNRKQHELPLAALKKVDRMRRAACHRTTLQRVIASPDRELLKRSLEANHGVHEAPQSLSKARYSASARSTRSDDDPGGA
jgi:hypothetical protein